MATVKHDDDAHHHHDHDHDHNHGRDQAHGHSHHAHAHAHDHHGHEHDHGHGGLGHSHGFDFEAASAGKRLLITAAINFAVPMIQIVVGLAAQSMALVSDAVHNFSDCAAVLIAFAAHRMAKGGATAVYTFGRGRAEVIGACVNALLVTLAAGIVVREAFLRLANPPEVSGPLVVFAALVGVAGNGFSVWLLKRDAKTSLNIRGAFLHMLGDLLTSVAVLVNGVILIFKPWRLIDPLLSLGIALFIVANAFIVLKAAWRILMNAAPAGLDLARVGQALEASPGVKSVHDLHAFAVCSNSVVFSCHVVVDDRLVSEIKPLSDDLAEMLKNRFGVDHPVLQFETAPCGEGGFLCTQPGAPWTRC